MKLLIVTQKVDKDDPILSFFHTWILKLSEKFESIVVLCLEKGECSLPSNVKVLSLGKEEGRSKIKYVKNFYKYIWRERNNYDAVFVHMNQEYVLLGGLLWKMLGKKTYMWRNHPQGNILTRIAIALTDKAFSTSRDSFAARFQKTILMPVGIDTDLFKISNSLKMPSSILFLGRIAPIKKPHLLLEALKILKEKRVTFEAEIYGDALPKDQNYFESLGKIEGVKFHSGVPNREAPQIYGRHKIYVNLTPSGSFDKTILEACVCGCIPIIANQSLDFGPDLTVEADPKDIAEKLEFWLGASPETVEETSTKLQSLVLEKHSLNALVKRLEKEIK